MDFLRLRPKSDPIDWIQANISLRHVNTAAHDGIVRLEPYQIRPIRAQYRKEVREVTIMAVEQTGKSACWQFPLVHKIVEYPGPRWIVYESEDKAAEINEDQFDPLLRHAPGLEGQLNRKTALKTRYVLPNGSTIDFSGAGADITSKPKRDGVADELDTWPLTDDGTRQNLRNFKKRFRTYWARGEGCLVKVSSPSPRKKGATQDLTKSAIAEEFDASYGGYWTLRCQKCGRYSIPSHAIYCLQWETEEDEETVKPDTLRLECPLCGHSHQEREAQKMNDTGAYCDRKGSVLDEWRRHMGFQWGALASPRVFKWLDIAVAQMTAGSTADMYAQADFFNSWRGLPFRPRSKESAGVKALLKHRAPLPDPMHLANVFFSADTQDNGWYWVVRGVDQKNNLYRLGCGFARTIQELKKIWDAEYLGILPVMGIIDEGGHGDMPKYVQELVAAEKGLYTYKGGAIGERWRHSPNKPTLIMANAKQYQADLLYYIYSQTDKSNNYWFIPEENEEEYLEQIAALQPVNSKKHGDQYENWESPPKTADHYFDAEKQILVILDVAYAELKTWRLAVPGLRRGMQQGQKRKAPAMEM